MNDDVQDCLSLQTWELLLSSVSLEFFNEDIINEWKFLILGTYFVDTGHKNLYNLFLLDRHEYLISEQISGPLSQGLWVVNLVCLDECNKGSNYISEVYRSINNELDFWENFFFDFVFFSVI
jgi:hypothetical protein